MLMGRASHLGTDLESANLHSNLKYNHMEGIMEGLIWGQFLEAFKEFEPLQDNYCKVCMKQKVNIMILFRVTQQLYNLSQVHSTQNWICDNPTPSDIKHKANKPNNQHSYLWRAGAI